MGLGHVAVRDFISFLRYEKKVNLKYIGDFIYSDNEINSEEIIELPKFKFVDLYEIDKDVKLEVDELNFIDHPYFSILIKVTEQTK